MKTGERSSTTSPKEKKSGSFTGLFPIAGIGTSAGGLEAPSIEIRGMRLPIDFFLRSLADERKEQSIGIILKQTSLARSSPDTDIKDKSALGKIIILLRRYTGNDFSLYKKNTLYLRIERRMGVHKIDEISSYVNFLQDNPKEGDILFKELMIGVTSFFRDPVVWEELKERVIPDRIASLKAGSVLHAWVPRVSTGEEAYSLAMVFKKALEKQTPDILQRNIKTFAEELLLQHFSPPGVLVNQSGDIIYISDHTGKYLEPATGKANMNIFAMLREGLQGEFHVAFHKAIMKKEPVDINNVKIDTNGYTQTLNIYL